MAQADDSRNAFDRRQAKASPSLEQDRKNRFARHDDVRRQARIASDQQDKRELRREEERERWRRQSATPTSASGLTLDAKTVTAKAARDVDVLAAKQPLRIINLSTLKVCVAAVMQTHAAEFFNSDFNRQSFNNAVQTQLGNGADVSPETIEAAYQACLVGNHFELPFTRDPVTGGRVSKRGAASPAPPTLYPPFVWNDEADLIAQEEQAEAIRLDSEKAQRALQMTFEDLQSEVRKTYKPPKPGGPNLDRS